MLEGLIAQARQAHGTLATPIRAAAAVVGGAPAAAGEAGGSSGSGGVTLIIRAVTDEQAQVGGLGDGGWGVPFCVHGQCSC